MTSTRAYCAFMKTNIKPQGYDVCPFVVNRLARVQGKLAQKQRNMDSKRNGRDQTALKSSKWGPGIKYRAKFFWSLACNLPHLSMDAKMREQVLIFEWKHLVNAAEFCSMAF